MATWIGLGDNTELFWAVLSQQAPAVESRPEPSATTGAEEPVAAQAEEEAPAEARLVDITSILGTPTVAVVRSSL
jgi:predicted secreted protein